MPVVEDFHLVLGQGAVVGYGVLEFETRLAETHRAVLARKDVVRSAFAIDVALSGDVKYIAWKASVRGGRRGAKTYACVTFDRDVDWLGVVGAVVLGERAEREGVVLGRVEVVSGWLHDGLEGVFVVCLCGECGARWGTREHTATKEKEEGEAKGERVDGVR